MFSTPFLLKRQFPALWISGLIITFIAISGSGLRALITGDIVYFGSLLLTVLFIPTLALTLGTLSGSNKLFEIVYMVIWYLGPLNKLPHLDFAGTTSESLNLGIPTIFLYITIVMIPVAFLARRQRLKL